MHNLSVLGGHGMDRQEQTRMKPVVNPLKCLAASARPIG